MASYLKSLRLVMDVTGNKNFKESYSNFLNVSQMLIVGSTNLSQNYSLYSLISIASLIGWILNA